MEEARKIEQNAQFLSSDDAKIDALQNKENVLPPKRKIKPNKIYESFHDADTDTDSIYADSIPGMLFVLKLNCTFLNIFFLFLILIFSY